MKVFLNSRAAEVVVHEPRQVLQADVAVGEADVGIGDAELALREIHRGRPVATAAGLVKHHRAVCLGEAPAAKGQSATNSRPVVDVANFVDAVCHVVSGDTVLDP
jgi:hypothetical protein